MCDNKLYEAICENMKYEYFSTFGDIENGIETVISCFIDNDNVVSEVADELIFIIDNDADEQFLKDFVTAYNFVSDDTLMLEPIENIIDNLVLYEDVISEYLRYGDNAPGDKEYIFSNGETLDAYDWYEIVEKLQSFAFDYCMCVYLRLGGE